MCNLQAGLSRAIERRHHPNTPKLCVWARISTVGAAWSHTVPLLPRARWFVSRSLRTDVQR